MRKLCTFFTLLGLLVCASVSQAQVRYLDDVFAEVNTTDTVTYGINVSIFPVIAGESPLPAPVNLKMDVYQPEGDTVSERPLIIYAITGTFFPAIVNGGFTGELKDFAHVQFAEAMARKGFVVAVIQYRRGWNAVGEPIQQQKTILEAAYRGVQDVRAAIRYFRKTAAEDGNPWRVDTDKIAVGGNGTGGYMAYGATYLKSFDQVFIQKFIDFDAPGGPAPFIDTLLLGDVYGVNQAVLNIANFPTYDSEFNVGFAMGGALGDSSWVNRGDVPFVSVHAWKDPAAPPRVGDVLALNPNTNEPFAVIPTASGGYGVINRAVAYGNQEIFEDIDWAAEPFNDKVAAISARADEIDEGNTGLYPFITPFTPGDAMCLGVGVPGDTLSEWISPWTYFPEAFFAGAWNQFYAQAIADGLQITGEQAVCRNTTGAPNEITSALTYMDTATTFIASRIGVVMDLFDFRTVGIENYVEDGNIQVFPNPAQNLVTINYKGAAKPIQEVALMDYTGRTIRTYQVNNTRTEISRDGLAAGMYLLRVKVDDKFTTKRVMFD